MYIYMYICMYVYIHVCMYVYGIFRQTPHDRKCRLAYAVILRQTLCIGTRHKHSVSPSHERGDQRALHMSVAISVPFT